MKKSQWFLVGSIAFGSFCILFVFGCVSVSPEELVAFKTKAALVREMSIRCEHDTALCCPALKEAARAMETIVTACED